MAKQAPTPIEDVPADDVGGFILPDAGSFRTTVTPIAAPQEKPGRVHGLNYDDWAVALVNLLNPPDKIASDRIRMKNRGYQKLQGNPIVEGYARPEVWVKPRDVYNADVEARHRRLQERVDNGELPESATNRPTISRSNRKPKA